MNIFAAGSCTRILFVQCTSGQAQLDSRSHLRHSQLTHKLSRVTSSHQCKTETLFSEIRMDSRQSYTMSPRNAIHTIRPCVCPALSDDIRPHIHEIYRNCDSQPFRPQANSLPGANRPIGPWPIRSLELSLPRTFALESIRSHFALWNFRSLLVL